MTKPSKLSADEKFERQDLDLFETLSELDKKNYSYLDKLSEEQRKKFLPFMMIHWMSQVKANATIEKYYVLSVDQNANKYFFNDVIQRHPKLQWMMLCASSPGLGKQFHKWVPHLSDKFSKLKDTPTKKELKEYYEKIYTKISKDDSELLATAYLEEHKKKTYLAKQFPDLKISDIETLSKLITDEDIDQYERNLGH